MVQKYKGALLEMALHANDSHDFCMAFFKYSLNNEISMDDWDPILVRELTKKLLEKDDR